MSYESWETSLPPLPVGAPAYPPAFPSHSSTAASNGAGIGTIGEDGFVSQLELDLAIQADRRSGRVAQGTGMDEKAARRRNQTNPARSDSATPIPSSLPPLPTLPSYSNATPPIASYSSHKILYNPTQQAPIQPRPDQAHLANLAKQYQHTLVQHYYNYALRGVVAPVEEGNRLQLQARTEGMRLAKEQLSISTTAAIRPTLPPLPTATQSRIPFVPPSTNVLLRSTSLATSPSTSPSSIPLPSLPASPSGLGRSNSAALPSTTSYSTFGEVNRVLPTPPSPISPTTINRFDLRHTSTPPLPLPTPPSPTKIPSLEKDRKKVEMENLLKEKLAELELLDSDDDPVEDLIPTMSKPATVAIPSFSFGDGDEGEEFSDSPPSFSFSGVDESNDQYDAVRDAGHGGNSYGASTSYKLHPRNDPSHPSHPLYQPTSILSPSSSFNTTTSRRLSNPHTTTSTATSTSSSNSSLQICHSCALPIIGRTWLALGKKFHPGCFKCSFEGCGIGLEFIEFGEAEEKGWCMVHFEELFQPKCHQCLTPISDSSFITVTSPLLNAPTTRTYHSLHFFCAECGDPFVDPSSLLSNKSSTPSRNEHEEEEVVVAPFLVSGGYAYCERCDLRLFKPKCRGCGKGISETEGASIEALGSRFHEACFACSGCKKSLAESFLVHEAEEGTGEKPYCLRCYEGIVRAGL